MNKDKTVNKKLLSIGEASEYLGVSIDTLRRWEKRGRIEPYRSPGGHRYYHKSDLDNLFGKRYSHDLKLDQPKVLEIKETSPTTIPQPEDLILDRPVRDIKIPEVSLIKVIKETEVIKNVDDIIEEIKTEITSTSILTPNLAQSSEGKLTIENESQQSKSPEKSAVLETNQNAGSADIKPKQKTNNLFIYISIAIAIVFFIGLILFLIGANSREILSPVP